MVRRSGYVRPRSYNDHDLTHYPRHTLRSALAAHPEGVHLVSGGSFSYAGGSNPGPIKAGTRAVADEGARDALRHPDDDDPTDTDGDAGGVLVGLRRLLTRRRKDTRP